MKPLYLAVIIVLTVSGCNTSVDPGAVNSYPLTKNNLWTYDALASLTNFRPVRAGITFRDSTITWASSVRSEGADTLLDSIATWKFTTRDTGAMNSSGIQHYIVNGDTLFLFAYYNPNLASPKRGAGYRLSLGGKQYHSVDELLTMLTAGARTVETLFVELNPPPVLVFPLTVGKEWAYRESPWLINKKIVGAENVPTPTGDVACYKIQWRWDINGDGAWDSLVTGFDYINNKGMIKRWIQLKDISVSAPENPEVLGYIDLTYEYIAKTLEGSLYPAALNRH